MLSLLKKVSTVLLLMFIVSIPVWAADADITQAANQIQTELQTQNQLSEQEATRVMARVREQLRQMARDGATQEQVNEVANQARQMIRQMANNAGALKNLHVAVSLMAKEAAGGKDPAEVGQMIRKNLQECNGDLTKACNQTRDRIRERDKDQLKDSSNNNGPSKTGPGNGGSGNGGSGGGGGRGK